MSDQFLGEIRIFGFNYAPAGWATCAGQLVPVSQYSALFSLLGINFGGNGTTSFGLPNLAGACAVDQGQGRGLSDYAVGESGGQTSVQLINAQMGAHGHGLMATSAQGTTTATQNNQLAVSTGGTKQGGSQGTLYSSNLPNATTPLYVAAVGLAGGGAAHENMMPSLAMNFCIALTGIFPQRP